MKNLGETMLHSLTQLFNHYGIDLGEREKIKKVCRPMQKDFLSLLHNFTEEKMFKFDTERFKDSHRLVHFGNNVFGVYYQPGYSIYADNGSLNKEFDGESHILGNPKFLVKFTEAEYLLAKEQHKQYWEWKNNRNEKRAALEEKYGIDTKHLMHLVRLLRMGKEILSDQGVIVFRPDAKELLEIRNGAWSYEESIKYAESMEKEIQELYKTTGLRKKPDIKLAAKVLMDVQDMIWNGQSKV